MVPSSKESLSFFFFLRVSFIYKDAPYDTEGCVYAYTHVLT